jgi:hypothetical protein
MSEGNGNGISRITKCRMKKENGAPCHFYVTADPLNVEIIGQPGEREQKFFQALMEHAAAKHKKAFALAQTLSPFFFAYLVVDMFETQDPALLKTRKEFEQRMRRFATPSPVTDDDIEGALGAMQLTMDDPHREPFRKALQHIRDYYEGTIPQQTIDSVKSLIIAP